MAEIRDNLDFLEELVDEIEKAIVEEPPLSITDDDAFNLRLGKIRERGYVLEKEEAVEGVVGVAAPVRDYARQVVAALGIALPIGQASLDLEFDHAVDLVKKACEDISSDLGYLKI